ncbi:MULTISPECIES: hypothetical protein [Halolamina]|uniref:Uncharacterized protein n=1 Tax=Halolamina pelagica TaxID=699431 RepID=A0A1I5SLW4_9EURY|nr:MULTISPECIES: hypothetical protein [Halolamina]NHX36995.1 hypothetical protein [Halolamina sp. R1-12]SFP71708.1 hypothetical protein SAMN05216277_106185 [Halolamina pelagica]
MADLQSCYFCASPEDLGEYAVVPPRLGGGDRSVVLCPDCKTKLLRVMDPLIERAEQGAANADASRPGSNGDAGSGSDGGGITMGTADASSGGETGSGPADPTPASDTPSTPATGDDADSPPQYDRAMRMLSNRPFPVDRSEVESMLANAYDLEREEIDAILDHAVDEGRLVAENGQLREP